VNKNEIPGIRKLWSNPECGEGFLDVERDFLFMK
jgi:hypothetical protein